MSILACLFLMTGQPTLAGKLNSAAACECSQCVQVRCCPCDSAPVPVSFPVRSSIQTESQWLVAPFAVITFAVAVQQVSMPLSGQPVEFLHTVHLHQRHCVYLI